jgi:hypothetical protein
MYTMALDNDMFMVGACISVVLGAPHNLHCMSLPLGKTCTRATIKEKRKRTMTAVLQPARIMMLLRFFSCSNPIQFPKRALQDVEGGPKDISGRVHWR